MIGKEPWKVRKALYENAKEKAKLEMEAKGKNVNCYEILSKFDVEGAEDENINWNLICHPQRC